MTDQDHRDAEGSFAARISSWVVALCWAAVPAAVSRWETVLVSKEPTTTTWAPVLASVKATVVASVLAVSEKLGEAEPLGAEADQLD